MKRLVKLLTLAAVVAAVVAVLKRRPAPPSASPTAPPSPATPVAASAPAPAEPTPPVSATPEPEPEPAATGDAAWADPTAEGGCPEGYPVKAKLKSRIFHVPGGVLYERTVPDRCYPSAEAAEADGLRASLR